MVAHGNGEIDFLLTLTDSEGLSSPPQMFTVQVISIAFSLSQGRGLQYGSAFSKLTFCCKDVLLTDISTGD